MMNLFLFGRNYSLKVLAIIGFSAFAFQLRAQNNCECAFAEQIKPQVGYYFNSGNLDSAQILVKQIKSKKSKICDILYYNGMSQIALAKNDLDGARNFLNKEFELLKTMKCPERLSKHYSNYSTLFNFLNKQDSAVHVSLLGLKAAEEAKDTMTQIRLCNNIAAFFDQLGQFSKTLEYGEKAMELAKSFNEPNSKAMAYTHLSGTYMGIVERTGNKKYLQKAFLTAQEGLKNAFLVQQLPLVLDAYNVISKYYSFKKDYPRMLNYADSILQITPPNIDFFYRNVQEAYLRKSEAYFALGDYKLSKNNADSSVHYGNKFNVSVTISPLNLLYKSSKKLGNYAEALIAFERMNTIEDSLFNLEKNSKIAELEKKYNQAKNEKTITELQQEDEIKGLRIRVLIILIIVAVFALVLIVLFFRQNNLKKNQQIMETEQRLNRSRMNPHFFFNALTTLQGLAVRENDGKKIALNLFKFSSLMRKTLESSYNDYVTVDQEVEFMNQYVELQKLKDPERFSFEIRIDGELESDAVLLPSMLIQPFLENSIEHGFAEIDHKGSLILELKNDEKNLFISIHDNGAGIQHKETNNKHISRATQITRDRLYLLQRDKKGEASFDVKENPSGGVIVDIVLPLIYK
jgi:tetratricopeptide (TPR) repeat protein